MQVFTRTAVVGSAYTLLLDETAGDTLETDQSVFAGVIQRENLAGSNKQLRVARGNVVGKQVFKWNSAYASEDAARAAIATINALKLTALHIKIVQGATIQYLPNAMSEDYQANRTGRSVDHTLKFETDDLTTVAP